LARAEGLRASLEQFFADGIWVISRADEQYPPRLEKTLGEKAPPVLFGAGDLALLSRPSVAVVGSRNLDEAGMRYATEIGRKVVAASMTVVSGGARGTDRIAMNGAIDAGGMAAGVLADSLLTTIQKADVRQLLDEKRLALLTPYAPEAGFSIGGA